MKPILAFASILLGFLLVSACTDQSEFEASQSTESVEPDVGGEVILVTIDSLGEISIDGQAVDPQAVRSRIEDLHTVNPEWPVVISADESSPTTAIVAVLDAAQMAGASDVEGVSIVAVE